MTRRIEALRRERRVETGVEEYNPYSRTLRANGAVRVAAKNAHLSATEQATRSALTHHLNLDQFLHLYP